MEMEVPLIGVVENPVEAEKASWKSKLKSESTFLASFATDSPKNSGLGFDSGR